MLGLDQVIVVVNKMDLVDFSEDKFKEISINLTEFLDKINISPSYIIPVSAKDGDNIAKKSDKMTWFDGPTILEALDTFKTKKDRSSQALRMPIQDVYKVKDKRIFAGRVESGTVKQGQEIVVLPSGETSVVLSVEEFMNKDKKEAECGESTGITLKDKLFVDRGHVICSIENKPLVTQTVKAKLFWMSKDSLKKDETITLKCATEEVLCEVKEIEKRIDSSSLEVLEENAAELKNMEVGEVVLHCNKEIIVDDFNKTPELGRFVIEKNFDTAGGGIITNLRADK